MSMRSNQFDGCSARVSTSVAPCAAASSRIRVTASEPSDSAKRITT